MKPATPKTELPPSTQLRKAVFGGSLMKANLSATKLSGVLAATLAVLAWSNVAFGGAIHDAAQAGDVEKVKALLKANPELLNSKDKSKMDMTPLHAAAFKGYKQVAELLLINKADVNAKANDGSTPLHLAALTGHKEIAELLLANKYDVSTNKLDVNTKNKEGETALYWAAQQGHKDVAELLLTNKADVKAQTKTGATALHIAAQQGHKDMVELLLAGGAEINARSDAGWTPLQNAESNHHTDIVELLLGKGGSRAVRVTGGAVSTFSKGVESRGTIPAGSVSIGPGGKLKTRFQFTGEYVAYDSARNKGMKLKSGMTMPELETAAKAAGVTYTKLTDDSAKVGNETVYFKDGKLDELEH